MLFFFFNKRSHDTKASATQGHGNSAGTLTPQNAPYTPQNSGFGKNHYKDVGLEILNGLQQVDLW